MSVRTGNFKKKVLKLELEKSILKDLLKKNQYKTNKNVSFFVKDGELIPYIKILI